MVSCVSLLWRSHCAVIVHSPHHSLLHVGSDAFAWHSIGVFVLQPLMPGAAHLAEVKKNVSDGYWRQLHVAALLLTLSCKEWQVSSEACHSCDKSALELVYGWNIKFFRRWKALWLLGSKLKSCARWLFVKRSVLQTVHVWHIYPSVNSTLTLMLTETC